MYGSDCQLIVPVLLVRTIIISVSYFVTLNAFHALYKVNFNFKKISKVWEKTCNNAYFIK